MYQSSISILPSVANVNGFTAWRVPLIEGDGGLGGAALCFLAFSDMGYVTFRMK